ncbi:hemolysin family protein [Lachnotalea glycerini]|uniref:HlyC/CorC family transporter n=1 Tax=Lachnotalea glycerini TaxID=1763509 RepID=A0A371JKA6_9FIRM|nr:hemolysin family protein [Lachnotalea glycerini]RDY33166.1 HlyC/CorC family transporter [Lachnotalea glycerini]
MTKNSQIIGIIVLAFLICVDALLYGFGSAIQAINENTVQKRAKDEKDRRSILLNQMIDNPANFINTIQIVINLISIIFGVFMTKLFQRPILAFIIIFYLVLTLGIQIPKKIGKKYCEKWAYSLVYFINAIIILLLPFTVIISYGTNLVCRIFSITPNANEDDVTEEEIISMVHEVHEQGDLLASEAEMINNIFELGDKEAKDIMTHRKNVVSVNGNDTVSEALKYMLKQNYSRFPVFEDDLDNIIGLIHLKDICIAYYEHKELRDRPIKLIKGMLRDAVFIPETRNINVLFQSMQLQKIHMVIIADEYGQTSGIIAMEDILEEIVGNILDEYDKEDAMVVKQLDGSYLVDGMTNLEDLEEILEIEFETDDCEILNGFLITQLDKIPTEGESLLVNYKNYTFEVIKVENNMIKLVKVTKNNVEAMI